MAEVICRLKKKKIIIIIIIIISINICTAHFCKCTSITKT